MRGSAAEAADLRECPLIERPAGELSDPILGAICGIDINTGVISRDEGLAFADSPTNLMWRLQNDSTPITRLVTKREEPDDQASFTEFTLDVRPEPATTASASLRRF